MPATEMVALPVWTGHNVEEVGKAAADQVREHPEDEVVPFTIHYGENMKLLAGGTNELVAVRVGDGVFVTTKPHSSSLCLSSRTWRTPPYAGCFVRWFGPNGEVEFFQLTIYYDTKVPHLVADGLTADGSEVVRFALALLDHAREAWFV